MVEHTQVEEKIKSLQVEIKRLIERGTIKLHAHFSPAIFVAGLGNGRYHVGWRYATITATHFTYDLGTVNSDVLGFFVWRPSV